MNCLYKKDHFVNRFSLQKTLRFALIPMGETLWTFEQKRHLEIDTKRKEDYKKVKKIIDKFHIDYIDKTLSNIHYLENLRPYAEIYYSKSNDKKDKDNLKKFEKALREEIAKYFSNSKEHKSLFKKDIIKTLLPEFLTDESEKELVNSFLDFSTYFYGYFENRKNMYTSEEKSTGIAYRCVNDNLPKHLDNIKVFEKAKNVLPQENLEDLNNDFEGICGTELKDVFTVDYFNFLLAQSSIDRYNEIIGGYTASDKTKVKGINEYINLYNQKVDKKSRIPNMKPLYKQILSDRESISFIPTNFEDENELLNTVYTTYTEDIEEENVLSLKTTIEEIEKIFSDLTTDSLKGIYIKSGTALTELSNGLLESWSKINELWCNDYDKEKKPKNRKITQTYEDKRSKAFKAEKSFSLDVIQKLIFNSDDENIKNLLIVDYYKNNILELKKEIDLHFENAKDLLTSEYDTKNKTLKKDEVSVALIKNFLDAIKNLEFFIKPLLGTGEEQGKNEIFYSKFIPLYDNLEVIDRLYDKVRNFVTQKPYSTEKIKLNFDNPQFLGGWPKTKEKDYSSEIFKDEKYYYLAVMDKDKKSKLDINYKAPINDDDIIYKMNYYQASDPAKSVPNLVRIDGKVVKKNGRKNADGENVILEEIRNKYLPFDINEIRKNKSYLNSRENFSRQNLNKYIEYYIDLVEEYFKEVEFNFKSPEEYFSFKDFETDINSQAYSINFKKVSKQQLFDYVKEGKIYLFQIYNKDFSEYSKGNKNLHTMYFEMLFDERNLENVVYKLNGEAEMFYRPASIDEKDFVIHHANEPINNKNKNNKKKQSVFTYDLIKDKRYTKPQFSLHLPITLNFNSDNDVRLNDTVRTLLKECDKNYVIGIDRGERHLLYVSVVDNNGEIVEQFSLNTISNEYNGKEHLTDYHFLLDKREEDRKKARQNWTAIQSIKELKEGYISQAVHKICQLVVKYDAIIVMEDLNSGFKNSRKKVEKQVYQKFEKMLIEKLNYYVDKNVDPELNGGLLNAYQLTNKFESFKKMGLQNGFIFYIPAWLTSKIDPVTGFVDLLKPHYKNTEEAKDFIKRFDYIGFNEQENYFEFKFNYDNFLRGCTDYRKKWTICTNGERMESFRNPEITNKWDSKTVNLTESFIELFEKYSVDYKEGNIKNNILAQNESKFYNRFIKLLKLTLQIRNSKTGTDIDYLISPVKDKNGEFYDSRNYNDLSKLPANADANGAYNIARKGLWAIEQIKNAEDVTKVKLSIKNEQWLEFAQREDMDE